MWHRCDPATHEPLNGETQKANQMQNLSPEGMRIANDLAQRHGFSVDAISHMMIAVLNGSGSMAQFSHSEFAGAGQWMRGGMLMLGDMFNNQLKNRVDSLCYEISELLANQPGLIQSGSFQSQSQGGTNGQSQSSGNFIPTSNDSNLPSLFEPDPNMHWWPESMGSPAAVGSQNNVGYAYFPQTRRLAVKTGDQVWVYDTQDHQIGGFSQQQGIGGSIVFTSQFGTVNLSTLPVVARNGQNVSAPEHMPTRSSAPDLAPPFDPSMTPIAPNDAQQPHEGGQPSEILDAVERLGELYEKGILTNEEFTLKKHELLERL